MADRRDLQRALRALAFRQAGYFSASQAVALGLSYQAQKYHADHGNWVRVDRALFRFAEWPAHADDALARWTVWSGGGAVVSHRSAADVHDLGVFDSGVVHLTVPVPRPGTDGVVLHVADLGPADVEPRGAFSVTTVERTLLDLATVETLQELVDEAVRDAVATGRCSAQALRRRVDAFGPAAALRMERALADAADL